MTPRIRTFAVGAALAAVLAAGRAPAAAEDIQQVAADASSVLPGIAPEILEVVPAFYAERGNAPAWSDPSGRPYPAAEVLLEVLKDAGSEGLDPVDYDVDRLERHLERATREGADAEFDVLFTGTMLLYAKHLYGGRIPPRRAGWLSDAPSLDLKRVAHEVAAGGSVTEVLGALAPTELHYVRLRKKLQELQEFDGNALPEVPSGILLRPGDRDARVAVVRARLSAEGYPASAPPEGSDLFDEGLAAAVRAFQADHGLAPDGMIGSGTEKALQHSVDERVRRVRWNMERLRWLPRERGEISVFVNAAGFEAELRDEDEVVWTRPVVVGQAGWHTPMFSDEIEGVELFPDWVVPKSIVQEEIGPKVRADPTWARRNNFVVIERSTRREVDAETIDWYEVSEDDYLFIQQPGGHNPLGDAKLLMRNKFAVYLHGARDPTIFEDLRRTYSHGCIRVQDVLDLTRQLFDAEGRLDELEEAVEAGAQALVELEEPVHVDIAYLTAWVDDEGRLQLRPDIYGRDRDLCRALGDCS